MRRAHTIPHHIVLSFAMLATAVGALAAPQAHAGFVEGSFKIDIGESARTLDALLKYDRGEFTQQQYLNVKMEEMWKATGIRLIDRNRPAILIQNTSNENTNNEISQFTIDIKQLGHEFGNGDFNPDPFNNQLTYVAKYSDAGVTLSSTYGTVSDVDLTPDPTKLVLNIGGLTPGKALMFRVDLDPVPMGDVAFPDYQCILVGGSDDFGTPSIPAVISALFASGSGENLMTTATAPADFDPADGMIFTGAGFLEAYRNQSASNHYSQTGGTEIPEPSAAALLLIGLATMARRRSRR